MTKYEFIFINMTISVSLNFVQCKVGNYPEMIRRGGNFIEQQLKLQWTNSQTAQGQRRFRSPFARTYALTHFVPPKQRTVLF